MSAPASIAHDPTARLDSLVWRGDRLAAPAAPGLPTGHPPLDAVLPGKIEAAIRGHVQALAMIQQSTKLTPSQKEELIAIAQTRRIDTVQVQKYEAVARTFNDATAALKAYAQGGGSPQAVFARLEATLSSFENEVGAMKEHGATMWEHGSLSGGDMTTVLMQQLADVAVRSLSPEDARALLPLLCGAEVGALVEVMQESSDMRMAGQLPIVLMTLLQAVATRAGETPQDAEALVKGTFKGSPTGLDLDGMRPGLALTLLTDPEKTDDHGVARNSPNAGLIAPDFDQRAILAGHPGNQCMFAHRNLLPGLGPAPCIEINHLHLPGPIDRQALKPDQNHDPTPYFPDWRQRFCCLAHGGASGARPP